MRTITASTGSGSTAAGPRASRTADPAPHAAAGSAAVAVAVFLAALVVPADPARAAVRFDFSAGTGAVDAADLRRSFGWSEATLRARAAALRFTKGTLIEDVYSVVCGQAGTPPVRTVHARQFATEFLTRTVDRGPNGDIRAVRITGPEAGISGTTVPPTPGLPCPEPTGAPEPSDAPTTGTASAGAGIGERTPPPGTVSSAVVVSTTTTLTLAAESGGVTRELLRSQKSLCGHPPVC